MAECALKIFSADSVIALETKWRISAKNLFFKSSFVSVSKSPTQMGSLGVKNTAANISPLRTLEAFTGYGIRAPCGLIQPLQDYKLSSKRLKQDF